MSFDIAGENIKYKKNVIYVRAYDNGVNIVVKIGQTKRIYNERDKEYDPITPIFNMAALVDTKIDLLKLESQLRAFANEICSMYNGKKERIDWFIFPTDNNLSNNLPDSDLSNIPSGKNEIDRLIEEINQDVNDKFFEYEANEKSQYELEIDLTVDAVVSELLEQLDISEVTNTIQNVARQVTELNQRLNKLKQFDLYERLYIMFGSFLAGVESVTNVSSSFFGNHQLSFDDINRNGNHNL